MIELNKKTHAYDLSLIDVIIDTEYFASVCGFNYPIGEISSYKNQGTINLVAEVRRADHNRRIQYGLMVWHNRNYVPVITLEETNDTIRIKISNELELPYPAIQRTKAWLVGLEHYLKYKPDKKTNREIESEARTKFLEGIYEKEFA